MGVTCNRCHKPESNRGRLGEVLFRQGSPLMSHPGNLAGQSVRARMGREPLHFQRPQGHKTIVYRITKQIRSEKALRLCPRIRFGTFIYFFLTGYFYFSCAQFHNVTRRRQLIPPEHSSSKAKVSYCLMSHWW